MSGMNPNDFQGFRLRNLFNSSFNPPQIDSTQSVSTPSAVTPQKSNPEEDITSRMLKLYHPETTASNRLKDLMDNYPKGEDYEPSMLRRIAGAIISAGSSFDADRGFRFNPQAIQLGQNFVDKPYNDALEEWKSRVEPAQKAAQLEQESNVNARREAYGVIAQQLKDEAEKHKEAKDEVVAKIMQQRANLNDLKAQGMKLIMPKGGNVQAFNPITGETKDLGISTGILSEADKFNLTNENALDQIAAKLKGQKEIEGMKEQGREKIADTRGWTSANIPDPNNPGQMMGVMIHQATGEVRPIQLGGQNVGPISKPGGPGAGETAATKTMREGARNLLPHVPDLRAQAEALDKKGLFGPIQSRIRELATKIGTTGSPEEVERAFSDFSSAVDSDPRISSNADRLVGQFAANLSLMASGAGRVHGGARGGGSIQMVNYMKSLLSSSSSLDMFEGRLDTLESYLKGYAAEQPVAKTSVKKSKIDAALEKASEFIKNAPTPR